MCKTRLNTSHCIHGKLSYLHRYFENDNVCYPLHINPCKCVNWPWLQWRQSGICETNFLFGIHFTTWYSRSAVREASIFWHNGGLFKGPHWIPQYVYRTVIVPGACGVPLWCREPLVSRTAARLIGVPVATWGTPRKMLREGRRGREGWGAHKAMRINSQNFTKEKRGKIGAFLAVLKRDFILVSDRIRRSNMIDLTLPFWLCFITDNFPFDYEPNGIPFGS